jgi:ArsR family transcriptional regulator, arsenate/arsenite/antimonite-responsive transcriptional repressor
MTDTIVIEDRDRGTRCCEISVEAGLSTTEAQQATNDLLILAHPVRLQILDLLARHEGKVCVCDIESAVPVKQPTVSHHLRLLRDAGLVDCERQGLWAYYFLKRAALSELRSRIATRLDLLS